MRRLFKCMVALVAVLALLGSKAAAETGTPRPREGGDFLVETFGDLFPGQGAGLARGTGRGGLRRYGSPTTGAEVTLPDTAGRPIWMSSPSADPVGLQILGSPEQTTRAEQLTDTALYYPETDHESGTIVAVAPFELGVVVETFSVLHGPESPSTFGTRMLLSPGQELVATGPNSAALLNDDGSLAALVDAPVARDASGRSVPVSLSVEGEVVWLHVDHDDADFAYPIAADPIWYYNGYSIPMNSAEFSFCKWPSRYAICFGAWQDSQTALSAAESLYPASSLYLGKGDAFRHCYWNGLMVNRFNSVSQAEGFATRHEDDDSGLSKTMDLRNNAIGRSAAQGRNNSQVRSECIRLTDSGGLWIVKNNELVASNK